jgi:hypothetical protein
VEPEDVVHVLRNMVSAVRLGGVVLDLQVIRPNPCVEFEGRDFCEIDDPPLLRKADAAAAAVDALIEEGRIVEEALDDHDARTYYRTGADLVDDFADGTGRLLADEGSIRALTGPCVVRERCRLRRLKLR